MIVSEIVPLVERLVNNLGFPIFLWLCFFWVASKAAKKIGYKLEPIFAAHLDLITELKNNSGKTLQILEKQNDILTSKFDTQKNILEKHSSHLEEIMVNQIAHNTTLHSKTQPFQVVSNGTVASNKKTI